MSKNKFEVVDYEDAVRLYGDIEFTFHDYWKHSFRYDNEELGLRVYKERDQELRISIYKELQ